SQRLSRDHLVLELSEDERSADDVADPAGADHDPLQGAPALGEQGKAAFALAAQRGQQQVAGAGTDAQLPPLGWSFTVTCTPAPAPSYPESASTGRLFR